MVKKYSRHSIHLWLKLGCSEGVHMLECGKSILTELGARIFGFSFVLFDILFEAWNSLPVSVVSRNGVSAESG